MTLTEIEKLAKDLADARQNLREALDEVESEVAAIKKKYMSAIRRAVEKAVQRQQTLRDAIAEAPDLFVKPKTVIFHGVRLGYRKSKGGISWEDEEQVIKLIKKHFPDDWDAYVKVTETVMRSTLEGLPGGDLKRIGVTVIETGDEVFIKPTDSEIDKMINALLKDEELNQAA